MTNVATCAESLSPGPVAVSPMLGDVQFHQLVKRRRRFSWTLAASMLVAYFSFILLIAFAPGVLGTQIVAGHPTTWGIPVGLGMLAFTFGLVAIYVHRANTVYDVLLERVRRQEHA
ncbi:membrane protein [Caballeronia calidae]|uniref:Membrane protein n=2 Tax=Caballeronia calidae TaxID=1777139 RepID=A0A158EBZ2_9BURK|nr:membrane protein [Caballeronia calidae]